jgi:MFS family permease
VASAGTAYQLGGQHAFLGAVPDARRGLAFGLFGTGMMGAQGIGPVLGGWLAEGIGAGATMTLLGVAVLLVAPVLGRLPPAASDAR